MPPQPHSQSSTPKPAAAPKKKNVKVEIGPDGQPIKKATRTQRPHDPNRPNFSYSALIGQAILSAPDKRLRLAEIYEFVTNNCEFELVCLLVREDLEDGALTLLPSRPRPRPRLRRTLRLSPSPSSSPSPTLLSPSLPSSLFLSTPLPHSLPLPSLVARSRLPLPSLPSRLLAPPPHNRRLLQKERMRLAKLDPPQPLSPTRLQKSSRHCHARQERLFLDYHRK
ncbi:hypothetical protein BCR35DRAFT_44698 [Leucosporidium creatinivorum]|uniref:Fork-head domain-containing protein n=1 Tax=Leucosporidium creatinivorum TaxID=106004 RepID=A0A1Y2FRS5_9BASI|nr:hypothetical protein BCR35DRAFT_44698 [Leucosporidium creatinivorum]